MTIKKGEYQQRRFAKIAERAQQAAHLAQQRKGLIRHDAEIFVSAFEEFIDHCIAGHERLNAREKLISLLTGITK